MPKLDDRPTLSSGVTGESDSAAASVASASHTSNEYGRLAVFVDYSDKSTADSKTKKNR